MRCYWSDNVLFWFRICSRVYPFQIYSVRTQKQQQTTKQIWRAACVRVALSLSLLPVRSVCRSLCLPVWLMQHLLRITTAADCWGAQLVDCHVGQHVARVERQRIMLLSIHLHTVWIPSLKRTFNIHQFGSLFGFVILLTSRKMLENTSLMIIL